MKIKNYVFAAACFFIGQAAYSVDHVIVTSVNLVRQEPINRSIKYAYRLENPDGRGVLYGALEEGNNLLNLPLLKTNDGFQKLVLLKESTHRMNVKELETYIPSGSTSKVYFKILSSEDWDRIDKVDKYRG